MPKDKNDSLPEDLEKVEKQSLLQRYLRNPFSIIWSKLASMLQSAQPSQPETLEHSESEPYELSSTQEQYSYPIFTDRVDPSFYYAIFFPHRRL